MLNLIPALILLLVHGPTAVDHDAELVGARGASSRSLVQPDARKSDEPYVRLEASESAPASQAWLLGGLLMFVLVSEPAAPATFVPPIAPTAPPRITLEAPLPKLGLVQEAAPTRAGPR